MGLPRARNVAFVVLAVGALTWGGIDGYWAGAGQTPAARVAYVGGFAFEYFMAIVIPFGILLLAWMKAREMKRIRDAMDDIVKENAQGEEKLREWIATKQSLEAQIGLVERSHDHDKYNALRDVPDGDPRGKPRTGPAKEESSAE